jgi:hypothetical protein
MGFFDDYAVKNGLWTFYDAHIRFTNRVMGGTPNNPDIIKGWLAAKAGVTDEQELLHMTAETLQQLGYEVTPDMPMDQIKEAMGLIEERAHTNAFKRDNTGLYLEDRVAKAMLREAINILYAGKRWGVTKKGPKSFFVERVFVSPARIHLTRDGAPISEADGTQLFIGHTDGPSGRQSNLTRYEYVERPEMRIRLAVLRDEIEADVWPEVWLLGERNGLGSLRSQSAGQFEVLNWVQQKATLELVQQARLLSAQQAASPLYRDKPDAAAAILAEADGEVVRPSGPERDQAYREFVVSARK